MIKLNDLSTGLTLIPDDESKSVHGGDGFDFGGPMVTGYNDPGPVSIGGPINTPNEPYAAPSTLNPDPVVTAPTPAAPENKGTFVAPTLTVNNGKVSGGLDFTNLNNGNTLGLSGGPGIFTIKAGFIVK